MGRPVIPCPDKVCPVCGQTFNRRRFNGVLEDRTRYSTRTTCSQVCGNTREEVTRSGHAVRARRNMADRCEVCGTTERLHAHHKNRDWADDRPENIATLCATHHMELHWREDRRVLASVETPERCGGTP